MPLVLLLTGCFEMLTGPPPDPAGWADDRLVAPDALPEGAWLLDGRSAEEYALGHIPGAIHAPWTELTGVDADGLWTPHPDAGGQLASMGLGAGGTFVVYADPATSWGADGFLYWTLRHLGAEDVRLLDGGYAGWLAAGGEGQGRTGGGDFVARPGPDLLATTEEVQAALSHGEALILDVRSEEEWRAGTIPTAVHLPWEGALDGDGFFLPEDQLRGWLEEAGLVEEQPVITFCAAGIRAGHTFFALELLGFSSQDYVGSWAAWTAAGGEVHQP